MYERLGDRLVAAAPLLTLSNTYIIINIYTYTYRIIAAEEGRMLSFQCDNISSYLIGYQIDQRH